ncbi:MAG: tryptophan--tRNA ligase [bacterium]|nr:tryptophan--tRNA ligase [bacterium]
MSKKRVLSGMQASGRLHLGNLLGALDNWIRLQEKFDCYYFIADWHALSASYQDTHEIRPNIEEIAIDWLCAGIDPEKSTLFIQSRVPEHAELHLLLSMITPVPWLERNPTYKEKQQELADRDLSTYGFLGYPVLQTADIVIYKAHHVPVGIDQLPHLELAREIVRRFNHLFGREVFIEPEALLSEAPKVPGTDGRKMSKSYDNCIYLSDDRETVRQKIRTMVTDPARARRTDPGNPDVCPVFDIHKVLTPEAEREACAVGCRTAAIGCLDCKGVLLPHLEETMEPFFEKRAELASKPKAALEVFEEGSKRARLVAQATMEEVREAMSI